MPRRQRHGCCPRAPGCLRTGGSHVCRNLRGPAKKERWNDYLDLAKYLKPKLEAIDGFIDNERFESKRTKGRVLSLSTWRDEKAVVRWRTQGEHHEVQEKGRFEIFEDYHLRVGEVTDDSVRLPIRPITSCWTGVRDTRAAIARP
ncbi:MAG: antibiotic biosynthesis monooxygenase [Xanthobacteraceae bacterium]